MKKWFINTPENLWWVFISCIVFYTVVVLLSRRIGLRSFSRLSSFDHIITLSMGALLASTVVSQEVSLAEGGTALITLFALQQIIAAARLKWGRVRRWVDSQPVLLMEGPHFLRENMKAVRITEEEIKAQLRAHNINSYDQTNAVVLERSGDLSVLYKVKLEQELDAGLLKGVQHKV